VDKARLKPKNDRDHWYCRGYLPHFDGPAIQGLTFCLGDGLPKVVLDELATELRSLPPERQKAERRKQIEAHLDRGMGSCVLERPDVANIVELAILERHPAEYELYAWVVMPNHVHLLAGFKTGVEWEEVIGRLKGSTSRAINLMMGRSGSLWQRESYDRFIRDLDHFNAALAYIHANPVKARLCSSADAYAWSSARRLMKPIGDSMFELIAYRDFLAEMDKSHAFSQAAPAKASAPEMGFSPVRSSESTR
jgi:putative transposase